MIELKRGTHSREVDAELVQGPRPQAFAAAQQARQEMFGTDVVVIEADRLVARELDRSPCMFVELAERDLPAEMRRRVALGHLRRADARARRPVRDRTDDRLPHALRVERERLEEPGRHLYLRDAEQQVLRSDIRVAQLPGFVDRGVDHPLGVLMQHDLVRGDPGPSTQLRLDRPARAAEIRAERIEDARGDPFAFANETEEQVLRPDVRVLEADGLVLSEREDPLRAVVKPVEGAQCLGLLRRFGPWRLGNLGVCVTARERAGRRTKLAAVRGRGRAHSFAPIAAEEAQRQDDRDEPAHDAARDRADDDRAIEDVHDARVYPAGKLPEELAEVGDRVAEVIACVLEGGDDDPHRAAHRLHLRGHGLVLLKDGVQVVRRG